jgi:hypothetical protein
LIFGFAVFFAGVSYEAFQTQIEIACRAGGSGFMAGRSIWRDAASTHDPKKRESAAKDAASRFFASHLNPSGNWVWVFPGHSIVCSVHMTLSFLSLHSVWRNECYRSKLIIGGARILA